MKRFAAFLGRATADQQSAGSVVGPMRAGVHFTDGAVIEVTVNNPGTRYQPGDVITVSGGSGDARLALGAFNQAAGTSVSGRWNSRRAGWEDVHGGLTPASASGIVRQGIRLTSSFGAKQNGAPIRTSANSAVRIATF